jgi:hypothetical protein
MLGGATTSRPAFGFRGGVVKDTSGVSRYFWSFGSFGMSRVLRNSGLVSTCSGKTSTAALISQLPRDDVVDGRKEGEVAVHHDIPLALVGVRTLPDGIAIHTRELVHRAR